MDTQSIIMKESCMYLEEYTMLHGNSMTYTYMTSKYKIYHHLGIKMDNFIAIVAKKSLKETNNTDK